MSQSYNHKRKNNWNGSEEGNMQQQRHYNRNNNNNNNNNYRNYSQQQAGTGYKKQNKFDDRFFGQANVWNQQYQQQGAAELPNNGNPQQSYSRQPYQNNNSNNKRNRFQQFQGQERRNFQTQQNPDYNPFYKASMVGDPWIQQQPVQSLTQNQYDIANQGQKTSEQQPEIEQFNDQESQ